MTSTSAQPSLRAKLGFIVIRFIVPAWVLTGAVVKLVEATPRLLPKNLLKIVDSLGLNLFDALAFFITVEVVLAALMIFVRPLARLSAAFTLSVFCAVMIGEMLAGSDKCGCMGAYSPPPWVMLTIDAFLLLAVLFLPMRGSLTAVSGRILAVADDSVGPPARRALPWVAASLMSIGGIIAAFGYLHPLGQPLAPAPAHAQPDTPQPVAAGDVGPEDAQPPPDATSAQGTITPPQADPTVNPSPMALPGYWYTQSLETMVGKPWREFELFRMMPAWPKDLDSGKKYVVFFSRTCEHCHDMFAIDFAYALDAPVTAILVPVSKTAMVADGAWEMPEQEAATQFLELPLGPDYIITTPLAIRIEDGKIACIEEGTHKKCLGLE